MALVNPNIALGIRQPEFTPRNAMAEYAQMQQIMNAQDTQQMNALKMQEAQFSAEKRNSLQGLDFNSADYVSQVAKYDPKLASEIAKERATIASQQAAARASGAAADKSAFELVNARRKFADDLKRGLSANPSDENIIAFGQDAVLQNLYPEDQVKVKVSQLLAMTPAERVRVLSQSGASAEALKPSIQQVNRGGQTDLVRLSAFGGQPTVAGTYADVALPAEVQAQNLQRSAASAPNITVSTGKKYGEDNINNKEKLLLINNFNWLEEEFLKPLGLTKYRLAKDIGVPPQRIGDIVAGKRSITADTDLRLCKYFGLSDGWWLRGQASYDTAIAKGNLADVLKRIEPCQLLAA